MWSQLLGGVGLFLLGMSLLTDGLKQLAGDALRRVLSRLTGGPLRALLTGAAVTALVQSSSATTLTTIGFVSAGLLSFPRAVGIVLGANLGTTSTGWIVSLLGLRVHLATFALPVVGVGALLRLGGRRRVASAGLALAGFGLVFVGIDGLQLAMRDVAARVDLSSLPQGTFAARIWMTLVGVVMTVVMQSSSAAVAMTLTALGAGVITLDLAAAMVVGQNVGTTVTALVASVGASVAARRTALAHVLFNLLTGLVAFAALPVFLALLQRVTAGRDAATALAAFHTGFNLLGVALLLPVLPRFAALVERMVPDRGAALTRRLDRSVAGVASVAVQAARATLEECLLRVGVCLRARIADDDAGAQRELDALRDALDALQSFMGSVQSAHSTPALHARHADALHAIEHLEQIVVALQRSDDFAIALGSPALRPWLDDLAAALEGIGPWVEGRARPPEDALAGIAAVLVDRRRIERARVMDRAVAEGLPPAEALAQLEAMRWIEALGHHAHRAVFHLATAREE